MSYLLDTSALLAHYRDEKGADAVQELFDGEEPLFLCSVSIAEFARRLRELGEPLSSVRDTTGAYRFLFHEVIPVDEKLSSDAFELLNSLPGRLPLVDAFIAAAAISRGACLVFRDQHLRLIPAEIMSSMDLQ